MKRKSVALKLSTFVLIIMLVLACTVSAAAASGLKIAMEDVSANAGDEIVVPIRVTEGGGFGGFKGILSYDSNILTLKSVDKAELTDAGLLTFKDEKGKVTFSFASVDKITGLGEMVHITFTVAADASAGKYSFALEFPEMYDYDANKTPVSVPVDVSNGTVTVGNSASSENPSDSSSSPSDTDSSSGNVSENPSSDTSDKPSADVSSSPNQNNSSQAASDPNSPATGDQSAWVGVMLSVLVVCSCGAALTYVVKKRRSVR